VPDTSNSIAVTAGRNLQASDATTNDIPIPYSLTSLAPLKGKLDVGSTITVTSVDGKSTVTLTVVGIYRPTGVDISSGTIIGVKGTVVKLSLGGVIQSLFYLKIEAAKLNQAWRRLLRSRQRLNRSAWPISVTPSISTSTISSWCWSR
jgi:putative ABC transport system permease protein